MAEMKKPKQMQEETRYDEDMDVLEAGGLTFKRPKGFTENDEWTSSVGLPDWMINHSELFFLWVNEANVPAKLENLWVRVDKELSRGFETERTVSLYGKNMKAFLLAYPRKWREESQARRLADYKADARGKQVSPKVESSDLWVKPRDGERTAVTVQEIGQQFF